MYLHVSTHTAWPMFSPVTVGSVFDSISTAPSVEVSARTSKRVSNASFMGVPTTPPPSILTPQISVSTDNGKRLRVKKIYPIGRSLVENWFGGPPFNHQIAKISSSHMYMYMYVWRSCTEPPSLKLCRFETQIQPPDLISVDNIISMVCAGLAKCLDVY